MQDATQPGRLRLGENKQPMIISVSIFYFFFSFFRYDDFVSRFFQICACQKKFKRREINAFGPLTGVPHGKNTFPHKHRSEILSCGYIPPDDTELLVFLPLLLPLLASGRAHR